MSEEVKKLPSKIVQYDSDNECALCDDGSVWCHNYREKIWKQLHPPHEPPTKSADLAEALAVLRYLFNSVKPVCETGWDAYRDAEKLLEKHGA